MGIAPHPDEIREAGEEAYQDALDLGYDEVDAQDARANAEWRVETRGRPVEDQA